MCVDDELLSTYLDGELDEPWRTQVAEHLQYCQACRLRLGQLEALHEKLQSVALTEGEMEGSRERVMAFFEATKFPAVDTKLSFWRRKFELKLEIGRASCRERV